MLGQQQCILDSADTFPSILEDERSSENQFDSAQHMQWSRRCTIINQKELKFGSSVYGNFSVINETKFSTTSTSDSWNLRARWCDLCQGTCVTWFDNLVILVIDFLRQLQNWRSLLELFDRHMIVLQMKFQQFCWWLEFFVNPLKCKWQCPLDDDSLTGSVLIGSFDSVFTSCSFRWGSGLAGIPSLDPELCPEDFIGISSNDFSGTSNFVSGERIFFSTDLAVVSSAGFGSVFVLAVFGTFLVCVWTMFSCTCWTCCFFTGKAVHRFPTWCCKSHNVKYRMVGCADRQGGALHSEQRPCEELSNRCVQCSFADSSFVQLKTGLEPYLCRGCQRMW